MTRIERFKKDITALSERFGDLTGKGFTIDLMELAEIAPRSYSQKKAYEGLRTFLERSRGCRMTITSQRMNTNTKDGGQEYEE